MKVRTLLIAGAVLVVLAGMNTINISYAKQNRGAVCQLTPTSLELTDLEESNILFMREEEKLARDVYIVMYEQWDACIFANISEAEQQHMDAVKNLITRYGLTDPVVDDTVGQFTNQDLKLLYDELIAAGSVSLEDALMVGVRIEELDIVDLEQALTETDRPNILRVFGNLLDGSYNHLDAFNACLAGDCPCL